MYFVPHSLSVLGAHHRCAGGWVSTTDGISLNRLAFGKANKLISNLWSIFLIDSYSRILQPKVAAHSSKYIVCVCVCHCVECIFNLIDLLGDRPFIITLALIMGEIRLVRISCHSESMSHCWKGSRRMWGICVSFPCPIANCDINVLIINTNYFARREKKSVEGEKCPQKTHALKIHVKYHIPPNGIEWDATRKRSEFPYSLSLFNIIHSINCFFFFIDCRFV